MAVPTLYQSTDASAPALTGEVGSLITVLDAILVDGYGAKSGAGWTKPYSGTNLAVYEASRGRVLHVEDDGSRGGAAFARIRGADAASGAAVADLVDPHPSDGSYTWVKTGAASAVSRPWKALATENAIMLFTTTQDAILGHIPWRPWFAGYFPSAIPGDAGAFTVYGFTGSGANSATNVNMIPDIRFNWANSQNNRIARDSLDATPDAPGVTVTLCPIGQDSTPIDWGDSREWPVDYPAFGGAIASSFFIGEFSPTKTLRGRLPSLLMPLTSVWSGGNSPADPWVPFNFDYGRGIRSMVYFPTSSRYTDTSTFSGYHGGAYVDLDDDWDVF